MEADGLCGLAAALTNDTDDDGKLSRTELTSALSGADPTLSVDLIRGDHVSGSTAKVQGDMARFASGTLHVDGASENHAAGNLAPDTYCTPKGDHLQANHSFNRKKSPAERVKEIMNLFDTDNDGVLDHREQMEMYRAILTKLESERRTEAANRNYDATAAIRDQAALIRGKIRDLDCDHEKRRQADQKKLFQTAMKARNTHLSTQLRAHTARTEKRIAGKIKLSNEKADLERMLLAKDLAQWPNPKPRYSRGLIEMRHAEMALATDQRYEEARNVRATTKVREAEEYEALLDGFRAKKEHQHLLMDRRHTFNQSRVDETVKDMRWRSRRYIEDQRLLQAQRQLNHERTMGHALAMEMHKVKGTTHNIALPAQRKPRPDTNASCRGSRLKEMYVGKRHMAIPSLSGDHNFKGPENFSLQEYRKPKPQLPPGFRPSSQSRGATTSRSGQIAA